MKHDGFLLYSAYQNKDNIFYSDFIQIPIGHHGISEKELVSSSIKWSFPLLYPDVRLKSLFYCKRVKSAIFVNNALGLNSPNNEQYNSFGADLTFDFHAFRLIVPIEAGYRIAYLPGYDHFYHQFLFSLGINEIR